MPPFELCPLVSLRLLPDIVPLAGLRCSSFSSAEEPERDDPVDPESPAPEDDCPLVLPPEPEVPGLEEEIPDAEPVTDDDSPLMPEPEVPELDAIEPDDP